MAQQPVRGRSHGCPSRGIRKPLMALLPLLLAQWPAQDVFAAGPDTSAQSFINLDHRRTTYIAGEVLGEEYAQPTAAAASVWALVGNSHLSYDAYILGACCTDFDYTINPVIVTGPFNGNPYDTLNLYPPPLDDPDDVERFGASLAIHGFRIAVGSTEVLSETEFPPFGTLWSTAAGGRVHFYLHNGTTFVHDHTVVYGGIEERFGHAVDLRLNALLVGRPGAAPGAADLFVPQTGDHIATFTSPGTDDQFGETVALLDDLALVGAAGSGTVYVYRHDGVGNWIDAGTLDSPGANTEFGAAIDARNGRILVGAPGADRAYIFADDGDADWPALVEISGVASSRFGTAVALSHDTAFISAPELPFNDGVSGWVGRYERAQDGSWPLISHKMSRDPRDGDGFGNIIASSSGLLAVVQSAEWGDWTRPGEFYIYTAQEDIWDSDADTVSDYGDNCADLYNPGQEDLDGDDIGDSCDPDIDNDGLSNTEEDNIGSDPYNSDTDGDGLGDSEDPYPTEVDGDGDGADDPVDNCPVISNPGQGNVDGDAFGDACDSNIDGDSLSNDAELTLGTDPYNPDTDGDLHRDGEDYLPLDFADGWADKHQFQVDAEQMRLGEDILLVLEGDERTLRSFAEVNGDWAEVSVPATPGDPEMELYGGGPQGNRFVTLVKDTGTNLKRQFYLWDWSPSDGWERFGPVDLSPLVHNLLDAALNEDTLVIGTYVTAFPRNRNLVFDITPTGPELREPTQLIEYSGTVRDIAGNYMFSVQLGDDLIIAYDLLDGYSSQDITWPDTAEGDHLGRGLFPVGPDKVFVDARNNSFWMSLENGLWSLELSGIEKWSSYLSGDHISGGDGTVVVHSLDPAAEGGFDLYRVHRVSDASEVGKFNEWGTGLGYSRIATNGQVVVQARRGGVSDSPPHVIDIFEVPAAQPPGC